MGWLRACTTLGAAMSAVFVCGNVHASDQDKKSAAGHEASVAVLEASIEGDVHPAWRGPMLERLVDGLRRGNRRVIGPTDAPELAQPPCTAAATAADQSCWAQLAQTLDVSLFVRLQVREEARNYEIEIEIVDTKNDVVAASSELCQVCGAAEVGELVADQAAALHKKLESLSLHAPIIRFASVPEGAEVYVDGQLVGRTPLEHEVAPGQRRIEVRKEGYLPQQRALSATSGVTEALQFELQLTVDPEAVRDRRHRAGRIAGWSLLGFGAASMAAGATFLALDEKPYKARCSGADVDAFGNCRQRYNTLVHGAVLASTAGAAIIVGSALLIAMRGSKRSRSKAQERLTVHVSPQGFTVGGRF